MAKNNVLVDKKTRVLRMVQFALLAAVEVILTLLYIPVGTINLNFGLVPIVVAAVCLSPAYGALMGVVSGLVTMFQVISGQGVFYAFLMSCNPVAACVLCVVKTAAAGLLVGLVYHFITNGDKHKTLASIVVSALCPVVNTGVFALGMLTIFGNGLLASPDFGVLSENLFVIVFVFLIGINFFVEFALSLVVCPVLCRTLLNTRFFKK